MKITKEWLNANKDRIVKIEIPNHIAGFVRWIDNEQINFMYEEDDGTMSYHIVSFDYVIEHQDEIYLAVEVDVSHSQKDLDDIAMMNEDMIAYRKTMIFK